MFGFEFPCMLNLFCISTRVRSTTNPSGWNGLDIQRQKEQQYTAVPRWSRSLIWDLWPETTSHRKCKPQIVTRMVQERPGSRETKTSRVPSFLTWRNLPCDFLHSFTIFWFQEIEYKIPKEGTIQFWNWPMAPARVPYLLSAPEVIYLEVRSKDRGLGVQECSPRKGPHTQRHSAVNWVNLLKWGTMLITWVKKIKKIGELTKWIWETIIGVSQTANRLTSQHHWQNCTRSMSGAICGVKATL